MELLLLMFLLVYILWVGFMIGVIATTHDLKPTIENLKKQLTVEKLKNNWVDKFN